MRILITGAHGLLGRGLVEVFAPSHELLTPSHGELDVTKLGVYRQAVRTQQIDAVIHAAAVPDPDVCHLDPDAAYRVNVLGARNAALACAECGAMLVQISTDYVFDGSKNAPYTEFDPVNPINVYGQTKLAAEEIIRSAWHKHIIVRTGVLFAPWSRNPLISLIDKARRGERSSAVTDQVGAPTYVVHLAQGIGVLLARSEYGLYNVVNQGAVSRYEWARRALELAGLDPDLVSPTVLAAQNRPAPRPRYTALRNYALELQGQDPMPSLDHALEECVGRIVGTWNSA